MKKVCQVLASLKKSARTQKSACTRTIDLLEVLVERDLIKREVAAKAVARLCAWQVKVVIQLANQLAILPAGSFNTRSIRQAVDVMQADEDFMAMATGMWDFRGNFTKHFSHVATVLAVMLAQPSVAVRAAAGFAGVWFLKAKLRDEAPRPPLSLLSHLVIAVARRCKNEPNPATNSRRLVQVFLELVELEYADRMDTEMESQALRMLALRAAEFDNDPDSQGAPVGPWLSLAHPEGTSLREVFDKAFSDANIDIALRVAKR